MMFIRKDNAPSPEEFYQSIIAIQKDERTELEKFNTRNGSFIKKVADMFQASIKSDDIVAEVFYKIWKFSMRPKYIENPYGWLYTVTVNCAKTMLRDSKTLPLSESIVAPTNEIENFISKDSCKYLVRDLSLNEKTILSLKIDGGFTFEEIAKIMRVPFGTVTSAYYRACDKLKEDLEREREKNLEKF